MRRGRLAGVCALVCGLSLSVAGLALGYVPTGSDFRISSNGPDDDATRFTREPSVAYNSTASQYLVVWMADIDSSAATQEFEVFGQRLAADGTELGGDFQISNVDPAGEARDAFEPAVAYNPEANEYLVIWQGDGIFATDNKFEVFGQRLAADGTAQGGDFRISNSSSDVDTTRGVMNPAVVYSPPADRYLVVWSSDGGATDNEFEIRGQELTAAGGPDGMNFQISNVEPVGALRGAFEPAVACCSAASESLVVWSADGLATDDEFEIFGQRVNAAGAPAGIDFRISSVGIDGDTGRSAFDPSITYNPGADEYLVTFTANNLPTAPEFEIFGHRVKGVGAEVGDDFRISNLGPDGDTNRDVDDQSGVAFSPAANEYLVVWTGDGTPIDDEIEVFGQRVGVTGGEIGSDMQISHIGADGDETRDALAPVSLAFGSAANEYLAVFAADGLATNDEFEIFGHRLALAPPSALIQPPVAPPVAPPATAQAAKRKNCKKIKNRKKRRKCKRRQQ
jgi:hypothetical protein